jgi:hypothetical protein
MPSPYIVCEREDQCLITICKWEHFYQKATGPSSRLCTVPVILMKLKPTYLNCEWDWVMREGVVRLLLVMVDPWIYDLLISGDRKHYLKPQNNKLFPFWKLDEDDVLISTSGVPCAPLKIWYHLFYLKFFTEFYILDFLSCRKFNNNLTCQQQERNITTYVSQFVPLCQ